MRKKHYTVDVLVFSLQNEDTIQIHTFRNRASRARKRGGTDREQEVTQKDSNDQDETFMTYTSSDCWLFLSNHPNDYRLAQDLQRTGASRTHKLELCWETAATVSRTGRNNQSES